MESLRGKTNAKQYDITEERKKYFRKMFVILTNALIDLEIEA